MMKMFTQECFKFSPNCFQHILDISINKQMGEHSHFTIKGIIYPKTQQKLIDLASIQQNICFSVCSKEGEKILFSGFMSDIRIQAKNDVYIAEIEGSSYSRLMDLQKKNRSFQEPTLTYRDIFNEVTREYNEPATAIFDNIGCDTVIPGFILQYQETDWIFLKRLASHFQTHLVNEDNDQALKYYIGLPNETIGKNILEEDFLIRKNLLQRASYAYNGLPQYQEPQALVYRVRIDDTFDLGRKILFHGQEKRIIRIESRLVGDFLEHTYFLQDEIGIKWPKQYNLRTQGLSLLGYVKQVSSDLAKIELDIDQNNPIVGTKWFPYSTVYSSPDGSGWYAMPEIGDRIRLVCPDQDELAAFTACAVHLPSSDPEFRANPDHKVLHTKHGKFIRFKPDRIELYANKKTYIQLIDKEGIEIITDKKIKMDALDDIEIKSENIVSVTGSEIWAYQGPAEDGASATGAKIHIDSDITCSGDKVLIEGD